MSDTSLQASQNSKDEKASSKIPESVKVRKPRTVSLKVHLLDVYL